MNNSAANTLNSNWSEYNLELPHAQENCSGLVYVWNRDCAMTNKRPIWSINSHFYTSYIQYQLLSVHLSLLPTTLCNTLVQVHLRGIALRRQRIWSGWKRLEECAVVLVCL